MRVCGIKCLNQRKHIHNDKEYKVEASTFHAYSTINLNDPGNTNFFSLLIY